METTGWNVSRGAKRRTHISVTREHGTQLMTLAYREVDRQGLVDVRGDEVVSSAAYSRNLGQVGDGRLRPEAVDGGMVGLALLEGQVTPGKRISRGFTARLGPKPTILDERWHSEGCNPLWRASPRDAFGALECSTLAVYPPHQEDTNRPRQRSAESGLRPGRSTRAAWFLPISQDSSFEGHGPGPMVD